MALQASSPSASGTGQRRGDRPRVQPYSEEAERGLVGASLLEPSRVLDLCTASGIGPGSFYISSHSDSNSSTSSYPDPNSPTIRFANSHTYPHTSDTDSYPN